MGHRVYKKKIPVDPGGGATEKNAESLDRADRGMGKGRKGNRRGTERRCLIFNKKRGEGVT